MIVTGIEGYQPIGQFWVCPDCAAMIYNRINHELWHDMLLDHIRAERSSRPHYGN